MSFNPLNHAIIFKKNSGDVNERREHCQEGLRGTFHNSNRISQAVRCGNVSYFRMEKRKNSKNGRVGFKAYVGKQRATEAVKKNKRGLVGNSENRIKYNKKFIKQEKILYFFLFLEYNPIILKIKGLKMLQTTQSSKTIDLRKTTTVDDIVDLEKKLLGVMGILDAFSLSSEIGAENSTEALALVRDSILDTIINQDIKMLKEKVSYMFGVCSDVYHGGELC